MKKIILGLATILSLLSTGFIGCVFLTDSISGNSNGGETIVPQHTHTYSVSVVEPTCESEGYTLYSCSCGNSHREDVVPSLGHIIVVDDAVEPTCTRTGLTEDSHCSRCKKIIVEQTVVEILAHVDENHDGYCNVCNTKFESIIDISTAEQLKSISNDLTGKYRLTANISLSGIDWVSLGSQNQPFSGALYGMGYIISGLSMSNNEHGGLFAYNSGTLDGIIISDFSFSLNNMSGTMGGLVTCNNGTILNCKVEGTFTVSNIINHYEERGWPNYDGTAVSYYAYFGGLCALNRNGGEIIGCELTAEFICEFSNTNNFQLKPLWPYIEGGDESSSSSTIYFGCIAGQNSGTIEDCSVRGSSKNTVRVLAQYAGHGLSTAAMEAYIGSVVGTNGNAILNCTAIKAEIIKSQGTTSLTSVIGGACGLECKLEVHDDAAYTGLIGSNGGSITNLTYNN